MHTKTVTIFALVSVISGSAPAKKPGATSIFQISKRLDLAQLARQTGMHSVDRPVVVDRGRAVYVAGIVRGPAALAQLIWLADHTPYRLRAPLGAWDVRGYRMDRLLYYDSPHQRAGLLLTGRRSGRTELLYAHWDLERRAITSITEVSRSRGPGTATLVRPIGYVPRSKSFWAYEHRYDAGRARAHSARLLKVGESGDPGVGNWLRTDRRIHSAHLDPVGHYALLAEYAERPVRGPGPVGHLVHLREGTTQRIPLPVTAYGIAFSPDGSTLFAYSSQLGSVWRIDARSGRKTATYRVGGLGHALGRVRGDTLALVRGAGIQLLDIRSGRKRAFTSMKALSPGFSHPEGSMVLNGQVLVKNGDKLVFVRVVQPSGATAGRAPTLRLR